MAVRHVRADEIKRGDSFSIGRGKWAIVVRTESVGDRIRVSYSTGVRNASLNEPARTFDPDFVFAVRN